VIGTKKSDQIIEFRKIPITRIGDEAVSWLVGWVPGLAGQAGPGSVVGEQAWARCILPTLAV